MTSRTEHRFPPFQRFSLGDLPPDVAAGFDRLPQDDYLKGPFAFRRRHGQATVRGRQAAWKPNVPFRQSTDLNPYAGGRDRIFAELEAPARNFISRYILPELMDALPSPNFELGVHQIRIVADDRNAGMPAPEGPHQDGFDFIAIVVVGRRNTDGGVTRLLAGPDRLDEVVFEAILQPGDILLLDDCRLAHDTAAIRPATPGEAARDVFILTFSF
jgi:hypothetical protein